MNALQFILREMQDDDADWSDQSERLIRLYNEADPIARKAIDDALICICGWSMRSVLERLENRPNG